MLKEISWVFHQSFNPCFSHTNSWATIVYSSYRSVVVRLFLGDQSVVITKDFICYFEEADVCVRVVLSSGADSVDWGAAPRRAGGLAVCTGLGSPRACRCCGTEWSGGIGFSGNPSWWWRRGCRASVLEPRNKSLVFAIALSLSPLLVYILHALIVLIFTCLIFILCSYWYIAWDCC